MHSSHCLQHSNHAHVGAGPHSSGGDAAAGSFCAISATATACMAGIVPGCTNRKESGRRRSGCRRHLPGRAAGAQGIRCDRAGEEFGGKRGCAAALADAQLLNCCASSMALCTVELEPADHVPCRLAAGRRVSIMALSALTLARRCCCSPTHTARCCHILLTPERSSRN